MLLSNTKFLWKKTELITDSSCTCKLIQGHGNCTCVAEPKEHMFTIEITTFSIRCFKESTCENCDKCPDILKDMDIQGYGEFEIKVITKWDKTSIRRVLSIDGGGTRGVIPIKFLKLLEKKSQKKFMNYLI